MHVSLNGQNITRKKKEPKYEALTLSDSRLEELMRLFPKQRVLEIILTSFHSKRQKPAF